MSRARRWGGVPLVLLGTRTPAGISTIMHNSHRPLPHSSPVGQVGPTWVCLLVHSQSFETYGSATIPAVDLPQQLPHIPPKATGTNHDMPHAAPRIVALPLPLPPHDRELPSQAHALNRASKGMGAKCHDTVAVHARHVASTCTAAESRLNGKTWLRLAQPSYRALPARALDWPVTAGTDNCSPTCTKNWLKAPHFPPCGAHDHYIGNKALPLHHRPSVGGYKSQGASKRHVRTSPPTGRPHVNGHTPCSHVSHHASTFPADRHQRPEHAVGKDGSVDQQWEPAPMSQPGTRAHTRRRCSRARSSRQLLAKALPLCGWRYPCRPRRTLVSLGRPSQC